MKKFEENIPKAVAALRKYKVVNSVGEYEKQYNGYISAFGASVMQSGLLPTIVFYSSDKGATATRSLLLKVLLEIRAESAPAGYDVSNMYHLVTTGVASAPQANIMTELSNQDRKKIERDLLQNAIAMKLALRLFKPVA